jgi:hypothetical protein
LCRLRLLQQMTYESSSFIDVGDVVALHAITYIQHTEISTSLHHNFQLTPNSPNFSNISSRKNASLLFIIKQNNLDLIVFILIKKELSILF